MWINPDTKTVYRLHTDIRSAFPNISFPPQISDADLESVGLLPVIDAGRPEESVATLIGEGDPVFANGVWVRNWLVSDASPDLVARRIHEKWAEIRKQRNSDLAASDWTQLPDAPVSQNEWAIYRQSLRDITQQDDPFNLDWPVPPT